MQLQKINCTKSQFEAFGTLVPHSFCDELTHIIMEEFLKEERQRTTYNNTLSLYSTFLARAQSVLLKAYRINNITVFV